MKDSLGLFPTHYEKQKKNYSQTEKEAVALIFGVKIDISLFTQITTDLLALFDPGKPIPLCISLNTKV